MTDAAYLKKSCSQQVWFSMAGMFSCSKTSDWACLEYVVVKKVRMGCDKNPSDLDFLEGVVVKKVRFSMANMFEFVMVKKSD
jgi:hypothetical protein